MSDSGSRLAIHMVRKIAREMIEKCHHDFKIEAIETVKDEEIGIIVKCVLCQRKGIKSYSMMEMLGKIVLDDILHLTCPFCSHRINDYMNQDILHNVWFCDRCGIISTSMLAAQILFPDAKILYSNEDLIKRFLIQKKAMYQNQTTMMLWMWQTGIYGVRVGPQFLS